MSFLSLARLFVWLYQISVKTAEPIEPNICLCMIKMSKKLPSTKYDFHKILFDFHKILFDFHKILKIPKKIL